MRQPCFVYKPFYRTFSPLARRKSTKKRNFFRSLGYFDLCGGRWGTLSPQPLRAFEKARPKLFYLRQPLSQKHSYTVLLERTLWGSTFSKCLDSVPAGSVYDTGQTNYNLCRYGGAGRIFHLDLNRIILSRETICSVTRYRRNYFLIISPGTPIVIIAIPRDVYGPTPPVTLAVSVADSVW